MSPALRPSPLSSVHKGLGARLVGFAGWEMPLQYRGILAEHEAVRNRAGLFDVSHLGKIAVEGPGAESALDRFLPGRLGGPEPWTAGYNLVLDESGGIVDDIFVYRHPGSLSKAPGRFLSGDDGRDSYLLVPNAANAGTVFELLVRSMPDSVTVVNLHYDWAILALSGPSSREILEPEVPEAATLELHRFAAASVAGTDVLVARTGYTGELTFEIFTPARSAETVWRRLLELGEPYDLSPAGLGARDLLRLEMGYPLHGQDISMETSPLEAGLEWVIRWEKDFRGKQALERIKEKGPARKLVGLLAESRRIPRTGARLVRDGEEVGGVTSGNFSPSLQAGIALGYLRSRLASPGTRMQARTGETAIPVRVTATPFLKRGRTPGARHAGSVPAQGR